MASPVFKFLITSFTATVYLRFPSSIRMAISIPFSSFHSPSPPSQPDHLRPRLSLTFSSPLLAARVLSSSSISRATARLTKHGQLQCTKSEAPTQVSDPKSGVAVYKPKSYEVLVTDAANSLFYALNDGMTRLEIDFPLHLKAIGLKEEKRKSLAALKILLFESLFVCLALYISSIKRDYPKL